MLSGIAFGAAVWFVSYKGWVPALGIMPAPERDRPGRPQTMLLARLVYGGVLDGATPQPALPVAEVNVHHDGRPPGVERAGRRDHLA